MSDGGAALVLMRRSVAERRGVTPLAEIKGHATFAQAPALFTTALVGAIRQLLERVGWTSGTVDLYEINEAFAVVPMAAMYDLACRMTRSMCIAALAPLSPIGASGARIIVTLLAALRQAGGKRGVAGICLGGGEATALAIELA